MFVSEELRLDYAEKRSVLLTKFADGEGAYLLWRPEAGWEVSIKSFPSHEYLLINTIMSLGAQGKLGSRLGMDEGTHELFTQTLLTGGRSDLLKSHLVTSSVEVVEAADGQIIRDGGCILEANWQERQSLGIPIYQLEENALLEPSNREWVKETNAAVVYTDGSLDFGSRHGGWGWFANSELMASGEVENVTSTAVELLAVRNALADSRLKDRNLLLATDCRAAYDCFYGKTPASGVASEILDDLTQRIADRGPGVRVVKVRGHSRLPGHTQADLLADSARHRAVELFGA